MAYIKITVAADNEEKAKKAFLTILKKQDITMGQIVNFSKVEQTEAEYNPEKMQYKIIYNDGIVSE